MNSTGGDRGPWRAALALTAVSVLAGCARNASQEPLQLFDLGPVAGSEADDGLATRDPVLLRAGNQLELWYVRDEARRMRVWKRGDGGLGKERDALPGEAEGALFTGRLQRAELDQALRGSSPALCNGLLLDGDERIGWAPEARRALYEQGEAVAGDWLAYDRFEASDCNLSLVGPRGPMELPFGRTARFEAHASVAIDGRGRVWVAWDEGGADWGRGTALHLERELRLAVLEGGVWRAGPALPPPEVLLTQGERRSASLAELPRLVADEAGPLWLFYREMTVWPDPEGREESSNRRVTWRLRALALGEDGWLGPVTLPASDGPNHDTLAVLALPGGGIAAAYQADGRRRRLPEVRTWDAPLGGTQQVRAVELAAPGVGFPRGGDEELVEERTNLESSLADGLPRGDPDPSLVPDGYVRLWGDLHRHTDQSRCKLDLDGTVYDQYRYALDVARLDFVAITDHFQHMTEADWEFARRTADSFDEPGKFAALFGFERALPNGHWTMVCGDPEAARTGPFLPYTPRTPWEDFDPAWIAIPHQLADRAAPLHWKQYDPAYEPVVEVFQSRRGAYEEPHGPLLDFGVLPEWPLAVDYLLRERRFGFVASSDHETTSRAFTAVLARERSRAGVVEALRARRCYAATSRMALDVALGELAMGAEGPVAPDARLSIRVDAGGELARVEVVRNGAVVHAWAGADADRGLLSLRAGRVEGRREIRLRGFDVELGAPRAEANEPTDELRGEAGSVHLSALLNLRDEDGFVVPLRWGAAGRLELEIDGETQVFTRAELRNGGPGFLSLGKTRFELRDDPAALGVSRLEADWHPSDGSRPQDPPEANASLDEGVAARAWQPGDWVYVRVLRTDGAVAWSSPCFVR